MTTPASDITQVTRVQWDGITHLGCVRKNNEDAFLGLQIDAQEIHYLGKTGQATLDQRDLIFAVSDGMGGALAGEFASQIAIQKITHHLPKAFKQALLHSQANFQDVLTELFHDIHRALLFLGNSYEECSGMGTTLSLSWFTPRWMYFAHIGDSRIYYFPQQGGIQQITQDDTYVGWLLRQGQINEREAHAHPQRKMLQKALGAGNQFVTPQVGAVHYKAGDCFLLCTDGLVEELYNEQLLTLLKNPEPLEAQLSPAKRLIHAALERGGNDNITALLVEMISGAEGAKQ